MTARRRTRWVIVIGRQRTDDVHRRTRGRVLSRRGIIVRRTLVNRSLIAVMPQASKGLGSEAMPNPSFMYLGSIAERSSSKSFSNPFTIELSYKLHTNLFLN
jgi:hypothetical protein